MRVLGVDRAVDKTLQKLKDLNSLSPELKDTISEPVLEQQYRFTIWRFKSIVVMVILGFIGAGIAYLVTKNFWVAYFTIYALFIPIIFVGVRTRIRYQKMIPS
jgi:Flp pilus assembly protein TadB